MNVLFFGQATGGNALLWFDYFNSLENDNSRIKVTLLARTICTLKHNFKVISPYGKKERNGFVRKVINKSASMVGVRLAIQYLCYNRYFDLVVLQGNYTPQTNLDVLKYSKYNKSILNIYGSDFYRKFLLGEFSERERNNFIEVIDKVDVVMCNWETTFNDFINSFPKYKDKVKYVPWGIDPNWATNVPTKVESGVVKFLSTRALHAYNNVDLVVEAFCMAYKDKAETALLHVVASYGLDTKVLQRINELIYEYKLEKSIIVETNHWYEGDELISLYDSADYNICFGSTDQLTLSIPYALSRKVINILSPIDNYKALFSNGFSTPIICDTLDVNSLRLIFDKISLGKMKVSEQLLEADRNNSLNLFNIENTFGFYLAQTGFNQSILRHNNEK
ncbi:hypothetical protein KFE26_14950 [Shewanella sp. M16]|uniref:hypothetical protein n=1 Tax=Shewanella sp. M16 TaxID=2830837 RepID=UPI001BB0CC73|nr:hypothetical protein [Shewanella sp. M16]MBS0043585.1 hypothetical protein [Shewanella sp. M16]